MTYLRNYFRAKGQLGYKNSNSTLPHPHPTPQKNKEQKTNKNKTKTKQNQKQKQKQNNPPQEKTPESFANLCRKTLYSLEFDSPASVIIPFYNVNDSTINIYVHTRFYFYRYPEICIDSCFGSADSRMIRYEVNCTNDESDVEQCISEWKDVQCPNGNDVGIKCSM